MAEGYLRYVMWKRSTSQVADKFELIDHYMKQYEHMKPKKPYRIDNLIMSTLHTEPLSMHHQEL